MALKNQKPDPYVCQYDTVIKDMHKILVGNGDPSKGLVTQMAVSLEQQKDTLRELSELSVSNKVITVTVSEIKEDLNLLKAKIQTASEVRQQERDKGNSIKRDHWNQFNMILVGIVMVISVMLTGYFGFQGIKKDVTRQIQSEQVKAQQDRQELFNLVQTNQQAIISNQNKIQSKENIIEKHETNRNP